MVTTGHDCSCRLPDFQKLRQPATAVQSRLRSGCPIQPVTWTGPWNSNLCDLLHAVNEPSFDLVVDAVSEESGCRKVEVFNLFYSVFLRLLHKVFRRECQQVCPLCQRKFIPITEIRIQGDISWGGSSLLPLRPHGKS